MGKYRKGIGITLLVLVAIPIIILSIPTAGYYYQFEPTFAVIEYTYIPLWGVLTHGNVDFLSGLFIAAYIGTILLAIWLIWRKVLCLIRHQWSKWQLHSAYGDRQLRRCTRCGKQQDRRI